MKSFIKKLLLCFAVSGICLANGCIQATPTLILKNDGAGSFDLEYTISEQSITQFKAMMKLREQLAAASSSTTSKDNPLTSLFYNPDEKMFISQLGRFQDDGIYIEQLSVKSRNAARQVHIKMKFDSLAKLVQTDVFKDFRISLDKNKNGDYVLRRDGARRVDSAEENVSDADRKALAPLLRGFNITARVTTPGMILRSNATKTSRHTAQWDFDFDNNPNAITDLHSQLMEVTFSGKTLNF